ncbi:hypothetical protein VSH64_39735 [Amycolatopsis rhabdoformis]|uniref:DUF320 domain-containing protein n=1 Tax=Amycolatopsis rhabdoformis TaxID=1448059 RepID=A0ABZ1I5X1_9PSEU|nr:hypothetical protein [Amycolatopsis rhabdoformis]WSE28898.1 hypothetical protein VSH64_39735 [Amycolatopsis rhabdoformis]
MSDAAAVRTGAPLVTSADPAATGSESPSGTHHVMRKPRPWAAPLAKPAARIALAGGLTVAGWLLGALVAGAGAEAAEQPHGGDASGNTVATAPGHTGHSDRAREHRREPHGHPWHGVTTGSTTDSGATGTSGDSRTSDDHASGASASRDRAGSRSTTTATTATSDTSDSAGTSGDSADGTTPTTSDSTDATDAATPSTSDSSGSAHASTPAANNDTGTSATPGANAGADASSGTGQHTDGDCAGRGHHATDQTATDTSGTETGTGPSSTATDTTSTETTDTNAPNRATAPQSGGGLLGGLLGGVLGLVDTTLHSLTGVVGTVGDVGDSVLPPVTSVPAGTPPLIPIGDVLGPVFSGGTVSGGVTATVPELSVQPAPVLAAVPVIVPQPAPVIVPKAAELTHYPSVVRLIPVQQQGNGAQQSKNDTSHVGATGGGGSGGGGGLPAAPSAPVAPTTTANPGHDGTGGARQPFAVVGDSVTTTQLKLIGVSRDHEVAGAGRDAALPTTSPD